MVISKDQAEEIKKQLFEQIEKLPNENKEQIKEYIKGLNEEELEEFLKKNKIELSSDKESASKEESSSECIFCSIIKNKIPYNLTTIRNLYSLECRRIHPSCHPRTGLSGHGAPIVPFRVFRVDPVILVLDSPVKPENDGVALDSRQEIAGMTPFCHLLSSAGGGGA